MQASNLKLDKSLIERLIEEDFLVKSGGKLWL